jgi:ketosteroid isomerase-like protein
MSEENIALVGEIVDAVMRRDADRLIELTDPDVEWHSLIAALGEGGVYRGHEGMRQYVRDLTDAWDVFHVELDQVISVGSVVVLVGPLHYRGKGSGVETRFDAGYMAKIRDGKCVYMRSFRDPEQALEAVGHP